jgi:hypothetical protein
MGRSRHLRKIDGALARDSLKSIDLHGLRSYYPLR